MMLVSRKVEAIFFIKNTTVFRWLFLSLLLSFLLVKRTRQAKRFRRRDYIELTFSKEVDGGCNVNLAGKEKPVALWNSQYLSPCYLTD